MTKETIPISEVFGPTIQGEGPAAGRRASFIRFGGCNLSCSWCDTPYTWDASRYDLRKEITRRPVSEVVAQVESYGTGLVVITGGEPLLHQRTPGWGDLLQALTGDADQEVHLETNGTIVPNDITREFVTLAVVSPKLQSANAGQRTGAAVIVAEALNAWSSLAREDKAVLKVVVRDRSDCRSAVELAKRYQFEMDSLWLMPEGIDAHRLTQRWGSIAEFAEKAGCHATQRLHILEWGDERGR